MGDIVTITKNGISRRVKYSTFVNYYEGRGFVMSDNSEKVDDVIGLKDYKSGGGWYLFPNGEKVQGESDAQAYFEANVGSW